MLRLNNIALIFLVFLTLGVLYAYAENPTPYNEWDFDFGEIEISQDPRNLDDMIILIPVIYKGDMDLGTTDISARVFNPDGSQFTHPYTVSNMEIGQTKTVKVTHRMSFDGSYIIDVKMTPPEKPHLGHVFDTETLTYVVEPNGREHELEVSEDDTVEETAYHLNHPEDVKYFEIVHAVINLPKENSYEKILVTNEEFAKEYPMDTTDIYIKSNSGYESMKVKLVKEGNLLPNADAQNTIHDYVKFYSVDRDLCLSRFCVQIDLVEEDNFPFWFLGFLSVAVIIPFLMRMKKSSWGPVYVEPSRRNAV